ncbi:MAG: BrnT family toxin [Phycisphaerales bacterium]
MTQIRFDWDRRKAADNVRKHRVSFDEAATVFADERAILIDDPDHPGDEGDRLVLIGISARLRLLVVVHCFRESNSVIRIISARRANRREESEYVSRYTR